MSAASDALAARLRQHLADTLGLVEKKMFGGICFMVDGNMAVGTNPAGELLVRVDPKQRTEALGRPGAFAIRTGTREMTGFVAVTVEAIADETALRDWIALALAYTATLPPK